MSFVFWFAVVFGALPILIAGILLTLGYGKKCLRDITRQIIMNAKNTMKKDSYVSLA